MAYVINKKLKKPNKQLKWIHAPKQTRSQETLNRILDAAEAILEEKSFQAASVLEIAKRAGSSVGSFYARFETKEALLHVLDERFTQEATLTAHNNLDYRKWENKSLEEVIRMLISFLIQIYRKKRGMLRAVVLHVRLTADEKFQNTGKRLNQLIKDISQFLLKWKDEMNCKDPELAVQFGIVLIFSTISEKILFGEGNAFSVLNISDIALEEELTRMYLFYLGVSRK